MQITKVNSTKTQHSQQKQLALQLPSSDLDYLFFCVSSAHSVQFRVNIFKLGLNWITEQARMQELSGYISASSAVGNIPLFSE